MAIEFKLRAKVLRRALKKTPGRIRRNIESGMRIGTRHAADTIKIVFNGTPFGFKDRTGALRSSIKGGIKEVNKDEVIGFISAGDNTIGTDGKPTRTYVTNIEFGEFSNVGLTAFLRPGALFSKDQVLNAVISRLNKFIK